MVPTCMVRGLLINLISFDKVPGLPDLATKCGRYNITVDALQTAWKDYHLISNSYPNSRVGKFWEFTVLVPNGAKFIH